MNFVGHAANQEIHLGRHAQRQNTGSKTIFKNTQLCKFFSAGQCTRGAYCTYAHSVACLEEQPDLSKTRICRAFMTKGCKDGDSCKFAHGKAELVGKESKKSIYKRNDHRQEKHEPSVPGHGAQEGKTRRKVMMWEEDFTEENEEQLLYTLQQHRAAVLALSLDLLEKRTHFIRQQSRRTQCMRQQLACDDGQEHVQKSFSSEASDCASTEAGSVSPIFSKQPSADSSTSSSSMPQHDLEDVYRCKQDQGMVVSVKNTFIHIEEPNFGQLRRSSSAPLL
eukprot:CAMPEP_0197656436 /NCGR_PEP_ID=MMETSP1338-20131121/41887_1 /TAXON_ID=43686 ORGANISM="Pelagodinium beii, Strain RCC1491" /NCGR_SAMPLE_ID=MMETSP1338 /ASSEMBLY_ACC=CAM_ASM_000754 /LENGTH=278 /DNA_ID=CAMNT_0043232435 /DNA_START=90 /DNA_END=926 /DNA_ORIENTATION=-